MAGFNLSERCVLLHREMPDIKIKRSTLSKIYKDNGIKKKVIKKIKAVPIKSQEYHAQQVQFCKRRVNELKEQNIPIVYLDESCLTTKTMLTHQYMVKNKNIEINEQLMNSECTAFVVALEYDKGFVHYKAF